VVLPIGDDVVLPADQRTDDAQVSLEPRGVEDGGRLADQVGQLPLQFEVDVQGPVQETGAGAARAVLIGGLLDRLQG